MSSLETTNGKQVEASCLTRERKTQEEKEISERVQSGSERKEEKRERHKRYQARRNAEWNEEQKVENTKVKKE